MSDQKWLPRIRGDRPYHTGSRVVLWPATPHTRGSTVVCFIPFATQRGYPAYAGIDPPRRVGMSDQKWLPRIRGDRPYHTGSRVVLWPATPHTRGSTVVCFIPFATQRGYPAYAGIDLMGEATAEAQ